MSLGGLQEFLSLAKSNKAIGIRYKGILDTSDPETAVSELARYARTLGFDISDQEISSHFSGPGDQKQSAQSPVDRSSQVQVIESRSYIGSVATVSLVVIAAFFIYIWNEVEGAKQKAAHFVEAVSGEAGSTVDVQTDQLDLSSYHGSGLLVRDILKEIDNNPYRASEAYFGKRVTIFGVLKKIWPMGYGAQLTVGSTTEFEVGVAACDFDQDAQIARIKSLNIGDRIEVTGIMRNSTVGIALDKCILGDVLPAVR